MKATGQDGGILVKCSPAPLADFYELETCIGSASGPWLPGGSFPNSQDIHAEGFTHGQDVFVHVRAVGTNGPGPWSDPATVLVS